MPTDVGSGAHYTAWEDIEVDGHYAIVWRRYYSTRLVVSPASAQGRGWRHGFDITLRNQDREYLFQGPDGVDLTFIDTDDTLSRGGVLTDPHQYELRYEHGRLCVYHWHDWQSEVHKFVFGHPVGGFMRLERIELPSGHGVSLAYDYAGRLAQITQDVERRVLHLDYDGRGLIHTLTLGSPGNVWEVVCTFQYDDQSRLVAALDAAQVPHAYGYDEDHRLTLERPRSGGAFRITYDAEGRCAELTGDGRYRLRRFAYNTGARITTVTDSTGSQTVYQLNGRGQAIMVALPNGAITHREFDELGRVVAEVGPQEQRKELGYDERGNLAVIRRPDGSGLDIAFDPDHLPVSVTEADGAVWQFVYVQGALSRIVNPEGETTDYVRNALNVIEEIRTPTGNRIAVRRDEAGTQEIYVDAYGVIAGRVFDQRRHVTALYDAQGLLRTFEYDVQGRLSSVIEVDGSCERFIRDGSGQLVQHVGKNGEVTSVEYTAYSDYVSVTNPNGATYRFSTDTEGRVVGIAGPTGERAAFEYDAVGNQTRRTLFDGRVESMTFDLLRRCVTREKSDGTTLRYGYGASSRIVTVTAGETVLIRNAYTACGQLIETATPDTVVKRTYDLCGRSIRDVQGDHTVTFTIGAHGFVEECRREGSGIDGLRFTYDARGRLVALGTLSAPHQTFEYNAADLLLRRRGTGMEESFEYDARRQLVHQLVSRSNGREVVRRRFAYDAGSNLVRESDSLRGEVAYTYGPSGLLLRSEHSGRGATSYEYDLLGNLRTRAGQPFEYEAGNRLTQAGDVQFENDANGNRVRARSASGTTDYAWDALDQLVAISHPDGTRTTFAYDGLGRRTVMRRAGRETRFYWAGDSLLSEVTEGMVRDYAIGEWQPNALWENGAGRHLILSYQGLVQEVLSPDGTVLWSGEYDDWGRLLEGHAGAHAPGLGLPGQQHDVQSGLHYNRFRYYDPAATRFISPDPLGSIGGFNGFLYAPNPINWADPLGLYCGKKGCRNTVYVLTKDGKIVYVGITGRAALTRMGEHETAGKDFDAMTVIASGLTRRQARNIEGSALMNAQEGSVTNTDGTPMALQNAPRTANPGTYYHSYDSGTAGPGRQVYTPDQTAGQLNQDIVTYPNP